MAGTARLFSTGSCWKHRLVPVEQALQAELSRPRLETVTTLALDDDPAASATAFASQLDALGRATAIVALWRPGEFLAAALTAAHFRTGPTYLSLMPLRPAGSHLAETRALPLGSIEYPAELVGTTATELLLGRLTEPARPAVTQIAGYSVTGAADRRRRSEAAEQRRASSISHRWRATVDVRRSCWRRRLHPMCGGP